VRDAIKYKMKGVGKKKPVVEGKAGQELYKETGTWRDRDFQTDRQNNRMKETITDHTGKVIRQYDDPLPQHTGRGSAKKKK
jgi:hypothetical protein